MSEIIKSREHVKNGAGNYDTVYKETLAELVKDANGMSVQTHIDSAAHITDFERTSWNAKQDALIFDTIPTAGSQNPVTSDGINTSLSKKANATRVLLPEPFDFNAPGQYGTYYIATAAINGPTGYPTEEGTLIFGYGSHGFWEQQLYFRQYGEIWLRHSSDNNGAKVWSAWAKIATATPPQWHTAVPENGYQSYSPNPVLFGKAGTGKIELRGGFQKGTATMSAMELIFTLPVGFRPTGLHSVAVVSTGPTWCGVADIYADGAVRWNGHGVSPLPNGTIMYFSGDDGFYAPPDA